MVTPIFYDGFEKSGKFYIRYDLGHDLELDLDHEGNFNFQPIWLLKIGVNFQKNVLDLHMTFNSHNDLEFDLYHDFEGHMKVKKIFLKINPIFNSKIG